MHKRLARAFRPAFWVLGAVVIAVIGLTVWGAARAYHTDRSKAGPGMELVPEYRSHKSGEVTCDALLPECGYCPGQVINDQCYIRKTE